MALAVTAPATGAMAPCAWIQDGARIGRVLVHTVPVAATPAAGGRLPFNGRAAMGALAVVASAVAIQRRRARTTCRAFRDDGASRARSPASEMAPKPFKEPSPPEDLYELLKVPATADHGTIKKAYYAMQKVCHPDVAGPEGQEMCILLNDAYDVLSNETTRIAYDEQLTQYKKKPEDEKVEVSEDLGPTWKWQPKKHRQKPVWRGAPRSRSSWEKVPPEERGPKHAQHKFVYVDEWQCISCRNCCDIAPHSFCIDVEHGRARAYTQWGNNEEYLDYAVEACPVDCIYWVSREELQALEHVTAEKMFDTAGSLPCSMSIMNGMYLGGDVENPFDLAKDFMGRQEMKRKREQRNGRAKAKADMFQERIMRVFQKLSEALKTAVLG